MVAHYIMITFLFFPHLILLFLGFVYKKQCNNYNYMCDIYIHTHRVSSKLFKAFYLTSEGLSAGTYPN